MEKHPVKSDITRENGEFVLRFDGSPLATSRFYTSLVVRAVGEAARAAGNLTV